MATKLSGSAQLNGKLLTKHEINCDMGEGFGRYQIADDDEIIKYIDRANIACGFHAGDYNIMLKTVQNAKKYGVKCGSHPGLPDKIGFGRRKWDIPPDEIYKLILYQTGALKAFLDAENVPLSHIKPHGELYFYIERDEEIMRAALKAIKVFGVPVLGAKNAHYVKIAKEEGVEFIQELYVDCDYDSKGGLVPPAKSRLKTPEIIHDSIYEAGLKDQITDQNDDLIDLHFDGNPISVCLHSDMTTALENIKKAREAIDKLNK
ncbi:hypothetical protein BN7_6678 [Wickerhamomyces ciferrii]|uniref:Lactam utilization protein n=1 Tax=Wickerhamomyces ciferrii (strain ATCC 14091 / BCRC 22168 / CBS 111 / JCM 3599 / NBRC 0793 / NRRL Y-1031 F-60-10) TaxID=1206466 RepID=K0L0G1_WICCF|nr:uncharacterized protein BN7_6678 [Wickerhamomyces ciferrii]CCH47069.1 hypothetical protein BN7_6678 [Wickerhamomyces ciferrii]